MKVGTEEPQVDIRDRKPLCAKRCPPWPYFYKGPKFGESLNVHLQGTDE